VPDIPGFAEVWGTSAHTCPYCEGFEHRDERLAILAADARGEPAECLASETTFEILRGQMCGCRVDNALAQQRRARFAALTLGRLVRVDP
jgi:hypothetical protein